MDAPDEPLPAKPEDAASADQKARQGIWRRIFGGHWFHALLHLIALVGGGLIALWIGNYVDRRQEDRHKRILIPVLIEGADRQGGQFALGVSRAVEFAHRYRLDQLDEHPIEPWLIDERKPADQLVQAIHAENPPIIVGPLRSTPALDLVPKLAKRRTDPTLTKDCPPETTTALNVNLSTTSTQPNQNGTSDMGLGIPVVLGIPTNSLITRCAQLVWRLSPTDDVQGDLVAQVYAIMAPQRGPAVMIEDMRPASEGGNPTYTMGLKSRILEKLGTMDPRGFPALEEKTVAHQGATSEVQNFLETRHPRTIIYVGMPDLAVSVLRIAQNETAHINATWIFTDSCITSPEGFIPTLKQMPGDFFITFQAPPAALSQGLQQYMAYTISTGGNVLFALESEKCNRFRAAPSYEVFGFDSYLTALLVIQQSKTGLPNDVSHVIEGRNISYSLLIHDTYDFSPLGDSMKTNFYLYQFQGDCTYHFTLDELKQYRVDKDSKAKASTH